MAESTPAGIDRAALERIIQRAAELQTSERDIGESLTPDDVLALGKEVGIPSRYLQQALLEERTRLAGGAPTGLIERAVGPAATRAPRGGCSGGAPAPPRSSRSGWSEVRPRPSNRR